MDGGLSLVLSGKGDGNFRALSPAESGVVIFGDAAGLSMADHDADGSPGLHFAINSAAVRSFTVAPGKLLSVELPVLPGTRVSLKGKGAPDQLAELHVGSGYLSQSAPVLFFARPREPALLEVRWPDGVKKAYSVRPGTPRVVLKR